MVLGIVSDTHGRTERLRSALKLLAARGAQVIVHCGDVGDAACLELLGGCGLPVYAVAGNMDRRVEDLELLAESLGVHFAWEVIEAPLGDGRFLAVTHGHDERVLGELVRSGEYPYVCHGHTHAPRDQRIGKTRVLNPGALHNASPPTVAVLDAAADSVELLPLPA